ncbi:glycoside hydrolase family 30 beta sandwich domain-containing protein [Streptomyces sp. ODS28]|uniref:glycoside hydrolase family 30 protein n=1 Tax=Streptomyces sp. ODS28 TaxID=3136688 RepID=UPI0031E87B51
MLALSLTLAALLWQAEAPGGGDEPRAARPWITTPDRSRLLEPGRPLPFHATGDDKAPAPTLHVDPSRTFQTMDGFGASLTDSSASVLYGMSGARRDEVMRSLFAPGERGGIGLSLLRQPVGSSEFVDGAHYTYNDLPPGETDLAQRHFGIAHDEPRILPLLRRARELNPRLKVIAAPWSPPAWMKEGGSLEGGSLKDDPAYFASYARYLVKFVRAYARAGVPVHALTVQNEPQNRTPDGYPGTAMPVADQNRVIAELGPMLERAGLGHVRILSFDHNWSLHPDDRRDAERAGADPEPDYPFDALRGPAARWIDGTAFHGYHGSAERQSALHRAFPGKGIWFTEGSGWHRRGEAYAEYFANTLRRHAQHLQIGATRNWARSVANWNLALDSGGGPVNGGCGNDPAGVCTGVLAVDGDRVTRNAEFYTLGHMSRFVAPGAVRIGTENAGALHNTAFRNPDGTVALVVTNTSDAVREFSVSWRGRAFTARLTGGALATYTWKP